MTENEWEKLALLGVDIEQFQALELLGDTTLISRIGLLVEQERILRANQSQIEEQLKFLLTQKHLHYEQLENRE
jgi:hypothetical protein